MPESASSAKSAACPERSRRVAIPSDTTGRRQLVFEIIRVRVGPQRALTAEQIGQMVGVSSREVRRIITHLICIDGQGEICANTGDGDAFPGAPRGYFWASCAEDAEAYRNVLISRIQETESRAFAAWQAIPRLPRRSNRQTRLIL